MDIGSVNSLLFKSDKADHYADVLEDDDEKVWGYQTLKEYIEPRSKSNRKMKYKENLINAW